MLTTAAAIVLVLVGLLAIPLTLTYQVSSRENIHSDVKLNWAFGLVRIRIPSQRPHALPRDDDEAGQKIDRAARSSHANGSVFTVFGQAEFRRRVFRYIADLWRAVDKKNIDLKLRLGLGDPADTGQLWAVVGPLAGMLATMQDALIKIEPDFFDATFELDSSGCLRFRPLQIVYLSVVLLLSPQIWRGISQARAARR